MCSISRKRIIYALFCVVVVFTAGFNAGLSADVWTQTEQADFELGTVPPELNSALSAGDITLSSSPSNVWAELSPFTVPSARRRHGMIYDTYDDVIIMIGGETDAAFLDEIFKYDPFIDEWSVVTNPATRPSARSRFGMAYSSLMNGIFIFGGIDIAGQALDDTWVYNITENTWTQLLSSASPSARYGHGMSYIATQDVLILFGGTSDGATMLDDTWYFDIAEVSWVQMSPSLSPSARRDFGFVTGNNDEIVLFGGVDSSGASDETWSYSYTANAWTEVNAITKPSATEAPAFAYDSSAKRILLFGGRVSGIASSQTWAFNPVDGTWEALTLASAPDARFRHSMVYAAETGVSYVFGGDNGTGLLNDMWKYSLKNYAASGTFVSSSIDAATSVFWTELTWGKTILPGTSITLKVRASDDNETWTDWAALDTLYDSNGCAINLRGRFVQYQAVLSTIMPDVTPFLNSVSLEYTMDPTWKLSSSADFEKGALTGLSAVASPGTLKLSRETVNGIYAVNHTAPVNAYQSKWDGSAWTTAIAASLPDDAESITAGDGDNNGEPEIYAISGNYIYRITYANSEWSSEIIAVFTQPWCVTVGDGNGDGENEVYIADRTDNIDNILQLKWQNSIWYETTVAIQPNGAEWLEVGDCNNDGTDELYAFCTDNKIYQFKWSSTFWAISEVGTGYSSALNSQCFALGDGDNDGDDEVYAITGPAAYTLQKYEWNGAVWLGSAVADLYANGAVTVGDGDNDGNNEVFAGGANPDDLIMFKWTGAVWTVLTVSNSITGTVGELRIADGDNNTVNEIYCIDGSAFLYIVKYTGSTWLTESNNLANAGLYGLDAAGVIDSQTQYTASGQYTSAVFDALSYVSWGNILWEEIVPANTSLTVQTRTGDTLTPDTTWSEWSSPYADTESVITSQYSRYIQFRAVFASSASDATASIYKVAITYTHPPEKPVNELPLDTETVTTTGVYLQASSFSDIDTDEYHGASQWQARLEDGQYTDAGAWNSGADLLNLTNIEIPAGILTSNNVYYWRVRYMDNRGGWSEYSDEIKFRYYPAGETANQAGNPPITPVNWIPLDGSTLLTLTPQLVSSAFSDLDLDDTHTASQWQIRTNYGDYTTSIYDSGITSLDITSITIPSGAIFDGQIYYWHVRYEDNNGVWSEYSTETSFIIDIAYGYDIAAGLPSLPVPLTPANGETVTSSVHINWQASTGNTPITYELQIALDSGFTQLLESETGLGLTEFIFTSLMNNTTYYWRVRSKNPFGTSEWTPVWQFSAPSKGSGGENGCFIKALKMKH
ncbi:MAG: hypothetical protein HZA48_01595 [Planctomycetes bacterium]|nr:hypothetical protein [Planctomycetota bacterium]